jgi:hypothetical protein
MNYFLVIFSDFFIFWIQIQIWILGPVPTAGYSYRTTAVGAVTAVSRAVTSGKKNLRSSGLATNLIIMSIRSQDKNKDDRGAIGFMVANASFI